VASGVVTAAEAAASTGGSWTIVEAGRAFPVPPPRLFGRKPFEYAERYGALDGVLRDAGVLALPVGRLVGADGWPVTRSGHLVLSATAYAAIPSDRVASHSFPLGRVRRLRGVALSLCSDWADSNYGHFLVDALSRVHLMDRGPIPLAAVDHVVVPQFADAQAWLDRADVPRSKVVWSEQGTDLVADLLVVTSYPRAQRMCPPWVVDFLRRRVGVPPSGRLAAGERIYVARRAANRLLRNSQEIEAIARDASFSVVEPGAGVDHRGRFAAADLVVGAHGAGLTNAVFSRPGATVLTLIPSDQPDPFFYSLSAAGGLKFACIVGASDHDRPPDAFGPSPFDFTIDPNEFRAALSVLTGTS
jgi:hypothetical protein